MRHLSWQRSSSRVRRSRHPRWSMKRTCGCRRGKVNHWNSRGHVFGGAADARRPEAICMVAAKTQATRLCQCNFYHWFRLDLTMLSRVTSEIEEIHGTLQDWLSGRVPRDSGGLKRIQEVVANDFRVATVGGTELDCSELMAEIKEGWGSRPDLCISVSNVEIICETGGLIVARYDECETWAGSESCRVSTVVFRYDESKPNDLAWLRLHETRLARNDSAESA